MASSFLDSLSGRWCYKRIVVSLDGQSKISGRHRGLVTHMAQTASSKVIHIYCAPLQIDIVVKASIKSIMDGSRIKSAYSSSVLLWLLESLAVSMNVNWQKKANRWMHSGRLLEFLQQYRLQLVTYTIERRTVDALTSVWWVILYSVSAAIEVGIETLFTL